MERYQIQSAVRQLALTTMHGSPGRRDERFYGDMIKDASVYLFFPPFSITCWTNHMCACAITWATNAEDVVTHVGLTAFKLKCWQSVLKVTFERQIGFAWIQRAFVCSCRNFQRTSMTLPVIRILYIIIFFKFTFYGSLVFWGYVQYGCFLVAKTRNYSSSRIGRENIITHLS